MIAALIELGGSHDECLYSQVRFLKTSGYQVHLICTANLEKQVSGFDGVDQFLYVDFEGASSLQSMLNLFRIRKHIIRHNIRQVIFNTAEGNLVRNLTLLPFPSQVTFSGTVHNGRKLIKSSSQSLISRRIKKYFVLNDYILPHVSGNKTTTIESFYPIFFPDFDRVVLPKPPGELWVCIPGQVDHNRRDYGGLLQALQQHKPATGTKFIVLGRDKNPGKKLRELVSEAGLEEHFILFDEFIPNNVFHSYLAQSDVILPLVHPGLPKFDQYLNYKITGAINLAFAYKKPLLSIAQFNTIPDFKENSLFYSSDTLGETLQNLPELLPTIAPQLYLHPKWKFAYQQQKYVSFIQNKVVKP
ncbi:hypothetical protein [Pontibacter fetidus]|uniref:Glycosyltransferase n=1 Tax=Pontibacter fetidus TaxID=2700082 RepID=A0A6B2HBF9_9BACT|nr:hypothetical protein [Pontibacter fetidus]NDK57232.1 hypothetical protein [Pontibacter fetidus]